MPRASTLTAPRLLLPLAALLATLPLILHGNSSGQDLTFHLQSWIDAAQQLRHGHYPRWDTTAAWNAGEPRFLFYPPLSWLLGAVLTLILPINATPIAFIFLALLAAGLTFHRLALRFASPSAALIASALYLANPYMRFNAFERSALAELLAAAWMPLLLLALLRPRPTVRSIAIPLALLWLTNAPAAVIGSYLLALLAAIRVLHALLTKPHLYHHQPSPSRPVRAARSGETPVFPAAHTTEALSPQPALDRPSALRLTLTFLAGTILGLALPAFYLLPAAYERRLIQSTMAIIPPLRYQDNFLFAHTTDAAHNAVNHTASLLALTLLLLTAAALLAVLLRRCRPHPQTAVTLSGGAERHPFTEPNDPEAATSTNYPSTLLTAHAFASPVVFPAEDLILDRTTLPVAPILALLTLLMAFLLTPLSTSIWRYLPDLAFIQFPWRLLIILTPILALALALLLDCTFFASPEVPGTPFMRASSSWVGFATMLTVLVISFTTHHLYAQFFDPADTPTTLAHNLATHHGTLPTDEYTPNAADNDLLRTDNPAFWLAPLTDPNLPAPYTHPTATELNPSIDTDDTPVSLDQTLSTPAPTHLRLNLPHPEVLILNLRDYPNWSVTLSHGGENPSPSAKDSRNDGLIAIPLYDAGDCTIDISWRRTLDQTLGLVLSALALLTLALTFRHKAHT